MHIVIGILAIIAAAYFWLNRAKRAADAGADILDMANDVRLAARRFGFKRKLDAHPVETVEDARLTATALVFAIGLDGGLLYHSEEEAILHQVQNKFRVDANEAEEMVVFGKWLVSRSPSPGQAIERLARRTLKLGGPETWPDLDDMLSAVYADGDPRRRDALTAGREDVMRVYRIA